MTIRQRDLQNLNVIYSWSNVARNNVVEPFTAELSMLDSFIYFYGQVFIFFYAINN